MGWRWAEALIKKLWEVSWDQWEHRNVVLHEEEDEEYQEKELTLNMEMERECRIGTSNLLQWMGFLFWSRLKKLTQMSVNYQ